jgi:NADH-quinone oxidoreductase subunit E
MSYLITQTFILLLIAGLLGLILGWYLTRLSSGTAQAALLARLRSAEAEQRELREARDAAVTAHDHAEAERRLLSDEVSRLRAEYEAGLAAAEGLRGELAASREALAEARAGLGANAPDHAALQAELDNCRSALESALAPAPAVSEQEVDSEAIASAAAAAASGALGLMGLGAQEETPPVEQAADDLQEISGIGPKIAGILRELGVHRFEQIAAWTPGEVEAINARLRFRGRIEREGWIPQAQALLEERGDA